MRKDGKGKARPASLEAVKMGGSTDADAAFTSSVNPGFQGEEAAGTGLSCRDETFPVYRLQWNVSVRLTGGQLAWRPGEVHFQTLHRGCGGSARQIG